METRFRRVSTNKRNPINPMGERIRAVDLYRSLLESVKRGVERQEKKDREEGEEKLILTLRRRREEEGRQARLSRADDPPLPVAEVKVFPAMTGPSLHPTFLDRTEPVFYDKTARIQFI